MKMLRPLPWIGACLAAAAIGSADAVLADQPTERLITLKGFAFDPPSLTVPAGTRVIWRNMDEEPHTVVSGSGLFRSDALDLGDSFSFEFDQPGEYRIICSIHPQMRGTVVVTK